VDPREHAAALLAEVPTHVWDGVALPVPVERIADTHCRLLIRDVTPGELRAVKGAPATDAISGLLLVGEGQIWVNAEEAAKSTGRRRFTIGHELGHWSMHKAAGSLFCRTETVTDEKVAVDIEEEASLFGAALLFPPDLLREQHAATGGDVDELCARFGGSRAAMDRAICFAVRGPMLAAIPEIEMFHFDDPAYEAWLAAHPQDGFVLNDDLGSGVDARLHRASCGRLHRVLPAGATPRTRQPKLCSLQFDALRDLLPHTRECTCVRKA
jgi:hypothetical protein